MPKWKRGAIIFIFIDALFILMILDDYYEFFIKECRDAFPFGYCPWGAESMGWAWRSREAYLNGLISSSCVLSLFLLPAVYCYCKKMYGRAFGLAIAPLIINCVWSWTEYFLYGG